MRHSLLFFLLVLSLNNLLYGQKISLDSLKRDYEAEKNDSVKTGKRLAYIYILLKNSSNAQEVRNELDEVGKTIEKSTNPFFISQYYHYEGLLFYSQNKYLESIIAYEKGLRYKNEIIRSETKRIGNMYTSMGLSYTMINDWESAQQNYQKAIDTYEMIKDSTGASIAYMNMAYIFSDVEDWENAVANLYKAEKHITPALSNYTIMIRGSLCQALSKLGRLKEAEAYTHVNEKDFQQFLSDRDSTFYFIGIGEYYFSSGKYDQALGAQFNSLKYARLWGDSLFAADAMENIGRIYRVLKKYQLSSGYLLQSKSLTEKFNYIPQRKVTLKQLLELSKEEGNYKAATSYATELINVGDSLFRIQNNNKRIIMDATYETSKKEKLIDTLQQEREIQQLKIRQKNFLNYILIGGAVTILIISLLSYRNYRQKQRLQQQRINELETEKQLAATEAVLKGEEQERTRLAKDLHDGLGGMLSGIKYSLNSMKGNLIMTPDNAQAFERSMDMLDSSIKEMRRVAHNMMPEALVKFGLDTALKDFCNDINQSGALKITYQSMGIQNVPIDETTAITIYRIVQELVNNILKHAAAKNSIVQVSKIDTQIAVTVEDDGRGFNTEILQQAKARPDGPVGRGIGWNNIENRIEFLKGKLDVNSQEGKGTSVHFEFNV